LDVGGLFGCARGGRLARPGQVIQIGAGYVGGAGDFAVGQAGQVARAAIAAARTGDPSGPHDRLGGDERSGAGLGWIQQPIEQRRIEFLVGIAAAADSRRNTPVCGLASTTFSNSRSFPPRLTQGRAVWARILAADRAGQDAACPSTP